MSTTTTASTRFVDSRPTEKTTTRTFWQYLNETIWACGCSVLAAHWAP